MIKIALLSLFSIPCILFAQNVSSTIKYTLKEGTIIKVVLQDNISGKDVNVGDIVEFELQENIVENANVVVEKGARVTGLITKAERSKALGKKGKLAFSIDYLYLPNGKVVKLRSNVEKNLKGSGGVVAAGAVVLSPVALLFNGKNAKYLRGEVFSAYVDKEIEL